MKREGLAKHIILAFLLTLVGYISFYQIIEHRRTRKGPWQVTFAHSAGGTPTLIIAQPWLAISNVQISFPTGILSATNAAGSLASDRARLNSSATNYPGAITTLNFAQPRPVPYEVPFGKCVFMDTTFLPGTITFELFGHEIELLPRVLIIDREEHRWQPDAVFTAQLRTPAAPPQTKP